MQERKRNTLNANLTCGCKRVLRVYLDGDKVHHHGNYKTDKGDCAVGFKFVGIIESVLSVGTTRPLPLNLLSLNMQHVLSSESIPGLSRTEYDIKEDKKTDE